MSRLDRNIFQKPPPRRPKLEIIELTDDYIKFVLSETDVSVANALRRVMISEVPTMAIEFVQISQNSSPLHDEYLAHRIGLIPLLSSQVQQYNYMRDCQCEGGCSACMVKFSLHVKNHGDEVKYVTSQDLRLEQEAEVKPFDQHGRDANELDSVLITKLGKNQELTLTASAIKGIGKEHAKWIPVSVATYQFDPDIRINKSLMDELEEEDQKKFVASCPTQVYEYKESRREVIIENAEKCMYCNECVTSAKDLGKPNLVSVKQKMDRFIFHVECTGQLKPDEIVTTALFVLQSKLRELKAGMEEARDGKFM